MEKTVNILFEVTETTTKVIGLGSDGKRMSITDISSTEIEKDFAEILRKIRKMPTEHGNKQGD